jgi:hypothetical protein
MFSNNNSENFSSLNDEDKIAFFSKQNSEDLNVLHAPEAYNQQAEYLPATNLINYEYEEIVDTSMKDLKKENSSIPTGADVNIDFIMSSTQNDVKLLFSENKFEEIIKYLNSNFPNVIIY